MVFQARIPLAAYSPDQVRLERRDAFICLVSAINSLIAGEVVPIEGKTLRGSFDTEKNAIHMASVWASSNGIVLGQVKTDKRKMRKDHNFHLRTSSSSNRELSEA